MNKNIFLLGGIVGMILFVAGCGQTLANPTATQNNNGQPPKDKKIKVDLPKGAVSDLIVGKKIMAMGSSGAGGTLTASQIIIGGPQGFGMFGRPATSTTSTGFGGQQTKPQNVGQNGGAQWQGRQGGQNGQSGQPRTGSDSKSRTGVNRMNRASGEIIKIDQNSMVLETDAGGSAIVYFTDKTEIFFAPTSTKP